MSPDNTANVAGEYELRWAFVDLNRHPIKPGNERLESFLLLNRSDVGWIASSNKKHRLGRTWIGLHELMQRNNHEYVRDIGLPAATSWAVHLELLPRTARKPAT